MRESSPRMSLAAVARISSRIRRCRDRSGRRGAERRRVHAGRLRVRDPSLRRPAGKTPLLVQERGRGRRPGGVRIRDDDGRPTRWPSCATAYKVNVPPNEMPGDRAGSAPLESADGQNRERAASTAPARGRRCRIPVAPRSRRGNLSRPRSRRNFDLVQAGSPGRPTTSDGSRGRCARLARAADTEFIVVDRERRHRFGLREFLMVVPGTQRKPAPNLCGRERAPTRPSPAAIQVRTAARGGPYPRRFDTAATVRLDASPTPPKRANECRRLPRLCTEAGSRRPRG